MKWARGFRRGVTAVCAALALSATGCSAPSPGGGTASNVGISSPVPSALSSAPQGTPRTGVDHVVIIVEENHSASTVLGKDAAPFINKLASKNALATNYHAVAHPSLPNYLALTSGTTAGITTDCNPGGDCMAQVPNITDALEESGRSWKMYAESMPTHCAARDSGDYAVRHNPFMYYPSVTDDEGSCAEHVVPLTRLAADLETTGSLPDYVFISPNTCNDMHDCPVATGDAWLSREVPKILESPAFTKQNSLLVLTWDEDDHDAGNRVATVFAGPAARKDYTSTRNYSHYSLLHTVEKLWELPPLTTNDKNAPTMDDMLK